MREPFRFIGHPVVLAITPFIFRPEKSGALPNRRQSAMSEHTTPGLFLIEGGLYSETAMREAKSKNTVYSRHQGLSKQAT